jgi:hypothetical protein
MSDIMQAYRDFQARVSADPQREAMRQTLQQSNSPFALLGRGVGNVANASLPPTADMLRAQIQSNPDTANPSTPEAVGNTIKFFQDMQTPNWIDPAKFGEDVRQGGGGIINEVVGGAKEIGNRVLGGAEAVADPIVQAAQGFMGNEVTGVGEGSFGRYGAGVVSVPPTPEDEDPYGLDAPSSTPPIVDKSMSTADIDAEGGTGERDKNWFDALESRVDLMAMGAAMLANAGSGRGTFENLGVALQAGLGAKKASSKAEQEKAYKDKLMALEVLKLQNVDTLKNQGYKVDNIASELNAAGFEDGNKIKSLATFINSVDPSFAGRGQATRSKLTAFLADNMGDNWVGSGGKPEMTKAEETYREGLELLAEGKL